MKPIYILIPVLYFATISCEQVITVNLNDSSPQIVIEGNISNFYDSVKVNISRTTDYFKPALNTAVTDASVNIADDHGNNYTLIQYLPGQYLSIFAGTPGYTYTLSVKTPTDNYTATSKMPFPVPIDSLWLTIQSNGRFKANVINCQIHDPVNIANYYSIQVYRADTLLSTNNRITLSSDKYYDGRYTTFTINSRRLGVDSLFAQNDKLKVELFCIDQPTYEFLKELRSILDQSILSASTPANPSNNISNNGLGYFSARSVSLKTMVVK